MEEYVTPKEEKTLEVNLKPIKNTYYKEIYEKNNSFLFKDAKPGNAPRIMNVMT